MPRVPRLSPATRNPVPPDFIHVGHGSFLDSSGRVLILRGVNLSGSSKAPVDRPSNSLDGFWEVAENGGESFVGRPLNLEDGSADIHLARLRGWGFNVIRYCVTWEALEHEGPRKYDFEFMDYTVRALRKIKEYGFKVYMDPHQDVWSRFSGGSGAPYWTLLACGLNPRNFSASLSAIVHSEWPMPTAPNPETLPAMIWSTNYSRLISQTIWTLFFAGRAYAPKCVIDGVNIQDWLQSHFIDAFGLLADRVRDAGDLLDDCVFAWDSINEPGEGFLGLENLNEIPKHQALKKGPTPTPIQGLRLATGVPQTVDNYDFGAMGPSRNGFVTIDPAGLSVWSDPASETEGYNARWGWTRDAGWELGTCVWAQHGVWEPSTGMALVPDYFANYRLDPKSREEKTTARKVDFVPDFWRPFWRAYAARIRQSHPEAILFIQPPVFVQPPPFEEDDLRGRAAYSAHYYDGLTLMTRHWNWFNADALGLLRGKYKTSVGAARIGSKAIRQSLRDQLGMLKDDALDIMGPYPTLIGEIGVPMEMDGKRAYGWTDGGKYKGDYGQQVKALDASLNGADGSNGLSYTMWTYCPDNNHVWGDGWNLEDLSIWSADDLRSKAPHMPPKQGYLASSSSKALLLSSRSRTSSTSSGPDGEPRRSQPTYTSSTPPIIPPLVNESAESVGSAATLANEIRLRPRSGTGVRFGESSPNGGLKSDIVITMQPGVSESVAFPTLGAESTVYVPPSNPFAFLTDGARAVAAFSRPYPMATVGRPQTIDFDINSTEFKFSVCVNGNDVPEGKTSEENAMLSTEIYVPLVHYASDLYWKDLEMAEPPAFGQALSEAPAQMDDRASPEGRSRSDTLASGCEGFPPPSSSTFHSSSLTLGPSSTGLLPTYAPSIPPEAYALEVDASCGSWTLDSQNQVLRWTYPVPLTQDRDVEYTIRIRRKGGPIKKVADGTITQPYCVEESTEPSWCDAWRQCCPQQCTIM